MRWLWIATFTASALTSAPACQEKSRAQLPNPEKSITESVANDLAGTEIVAELNQSVDAKKAKLGDLVKATVTQDVLAHGRIAIRRGSKLVGHVTQTKPRGKDGEESRLGVVFDKAILKRGQEIDFAAAVRALAPAVRISSVDRPDPMMPPATGGMGQSTAQPISGGMAPSGRGSIGGSSVSTNSSSTIQNQSARAAELASASPGGAAAPQSGLMGGGSRGVFGMPGVHLSPEPAGGNGSVISSTTHNVKLDSGTQMVIQINKVFR